MKTEMKSRKPYIDFLRLLAAFLVIYNHTTGYELFLQGIENPIEMWIALIISMFTRINTPLFFMITGALLLGKDESYKTLLNKRVVRFVIVLLCASLVIYIYQKRVAFNIMEFVSCFFNGTLLIEYWFLYAYLGLLLMLPFLRKIAKHISGKDVVFLIVLKVMFYSVYSILTYMFRSFELDFITLSGSFQYPIAAINILFYPIVGYYLANVLKVERIRRCEIVLLIVSVIGALVIPSVLTYHQGITTGFTQGFVMLFDYIIAIAIFIFVRCIFERRTPKNESGLFENMLSFFGSLTLGIYLMDPLLRALAFDRIYYGVFDGKIHAIVYSMMWCVFSMIVCGTITYFLKKLPIIRKLL